MTTKHRALIALLAAAAATGGMLSVSAVKDVLRATCAPPETRLARLLPDGTRAETITIDLTRLQGWVNAACDQPEVSVVDSVEFRVTGPGR